MNCSPGSTGELGGLLKPTENVPAIKEIGYRIQKSKKPFDPRIEKINPQIHYNEKEIFTMTVKLLLSLALILSIVIPFGAFAAGEKSKGRYKTALAVNSLLFFGTLLTCSALFFTRNAFAAEEAAAANPAAGMICMAAAISTGLSCIGGGIAVSAAASAALGAISEDSSILGKSLIFVGLAEGVCLYGLHHCR